MPCHNSQPKSTAIAAAPNNTTKTIANNDKTPPPLADHPSSRDTHRHVVPHPAHSTIRIGFPSMWAAQVVVSQGTPVL